MLTEQQKNDLAQPLAPDRVSTRQGPNGARLSYLEGHDVIATANTIFGFDGWSYEVQRYTDRTVTRTGRNGEYEASEVIAHVRVTVGEVVREDVGFGDGDFELAHKEAVTDALKRALRTFGDQFGNGLYEKPSGQQNASQQRPASNGRASSNGSAPKAPGEIKNIGDVMNLGRSLGLEPKRIKEVVGEPKDINERGLSESAELLRAAAEVTA